ncbi:hypothetical protein H0H93_009488, partial [Arthromyces matolae]
MDQIPSKEEIARCTDHYYGLAVEEYTKVDGLLLEGWRLKKKVLSEMEKSTTFDKSKFRAIVDNQLALVSVYTSATSHVPTKYVSRGLNAFRRDLTAMVERCDKTGNSAKRSAPAALLDDPDRLRKRPALEVT